MLGIGMLLNTPGYQKGQKAAETSRPLSDNPFTEGSNPWSDWNAAWRVTTRMADIEATRIAALRMPAGSAFDMGRAAALKKLSAAANPFLHSSPRHEEWRLGWAQAVRLRRPELDRF
jgi:hypothetical protein